MQKTVLITGASRGLGRAIAIVFLKRGWRVGINYVNSRQAAGELASEKGGELFPGDISSREAVAGIFREIKDRFGRLDVVINNAGINKDRLLVKTTPEDWQRVINVNLTGTFNVCRQAVRLMRPAGGHIVNISSLAAVTGRKGQCAYTASKAGLIGFSRSLARELAGGNIKVNVVLPGYMNTAMVDSTTLARAHQENILGRINEPGEVARFIYQLVSASFISGQVFNLDSRII